MNRRSLLTWSGHAIRLMVGATFVYAGATKVISPVRFITDVSNYHLLMWPMAVGLALYLPWLEMISGLAFLLRRLYRGALTIVLALMAIFIAASISAKLRGINVVCGCFGAPSRNLSFVSHILIDIVLLIAIVALWIIDNRIRAPIIKGQ